MDQRAEKTAPDSSTLWLAIGLGGFSVFASFFLAIYYSNINAGEEEVAREASALEVVEHASE